MPRLAALLALLVTATLIPSTRADDASPNIVFVIADDCTYNDLGPWGGTNVKTPNLDRLSSQGLTFERAYTSMPMCTPTRAAIYTGQYPMTTGVVWNHAAARPGTQSWPQRFGQLGYRVGIAGKTHVLPDDVFPFEYVEGVAGNPVGERADFDGKGITDFINRDDEQPFALVVAFTSPHVPWTAGDKSQFKPADLTVPEHLADNPGVRRALVDYYAEIALLDEQLGEVMQIVDDAGKAENTIFIFCSEQGAQMPGVKWNLYDFGTHTGLIVRWPDHIEPGRRTDALVQDVDILPTLLDATGNDVPAELDGLSFLPVLTGDGDGEREFVYTMHNNVPEGPPYPIRAVSDGEMLYVRNLAPEHAYVNRFMMGGDGRDSGMWLAFTNNGAWNEHARMLMDRMIIRQPEEFFNVQTDPGCLEDLAGDDSHLDDMKRLSSELDRYMNQSGDPGASLDDGKVMQKQNKAHRNN